jgi:hypothetical protein
MATFEEHCQETLEELGDRFEHVHKWMDELQPVLGPDHRKVRHNEAGIQYVHDTWGEMAGRAARIHVDRDENSHVKEGALWVPKSMKKTKTTDAVWHTSMGVRVRIAEADEKKLTGVVRVVRIEDGHEFDIDRKDLRPAIQHG